MLRASRSTGKVALEQLSALSGNVFSFILACSGSCPDLGGRRGLLWSSFAAWSLSELVNAEFGQENFGCESASRSLFLKDIVPEQTIKHLWAVGEFLFFWGGRCFWVL